MTLEARLIDDLLDLTRITQGKLLLEKQRMDVHEVLREALATIQDDAKLKHISLTLNLNARENLLFADTVRMQQIFWNVLKNAVKFTQEGGHIVVDDGHDIDQRGDRDQGDRHRHRHHAGRNSISIFSVLLPWRDHAGLHGSHRFGGLGLGLTISRMLVELHSGNIRAESAGRRPPLPSSYPSFPPKTVCLKQRPVEPKTDFVRKEGMRILVVEDHEPTRVALVQLLTRRRYKVTTAGTVAEARRLADKETFDLVLSDIGLPDGSGYALMAERCDNWLGACGGRLYVGGMEEDVARSKVSGFVAHLTKPVRLESLERALSTAK